MSAVSPCDRESIHVSLMCTQDVSAFSSIIMTSFTSKPSRNEWILVWFITSLALKKCRSVSWTCGYFSFSECTGSPHTTVQLCSKSTFIAPETNATVVSSRRTPMFGSAVESVKSHCRRFTGSSLAKTQNGTLVVPKFPFGIVKVFWVLLACHCASPNLTSNDMMLEIRRRHVHPHSPAEVDRITRICFMMSNL